jgi:polysaccharide transporter, PST family
VSPYFDDNTIEAGHGQRSLRAGAVILGARVGVVAIQIATLLVLARLLSPEDYGLVSMVTAITAFAPLLVGLGTPDAVVQRTRITQQDVSTLFWISLALGIGAAMLMAACSPAVARFYGEPRLFWITNVSALTFLTTALACQHHTLLRRAMKFRDLAVLDVGANVLSAGCAIAMALAGFEYWALVLRPIVLTALIALGVWVRCRWIPRKPELSTGAKEMLRMGLHSVGFSVTDFVAGSSDRVAIGHRSGANALGHYQNAMLFYDSMIGLLMTSAHGVAVTSLSKSTHDLTELRRLWRKALLTLEFYAMPAFGMLAVISQDLIVLLLGSKWAQAGMLLSILSLRGIPHTVERTLGWLHVAAGRTDRWMRWGLFAMSAQLVALFSGLPFGPTGVAVAYAVCMFLLFVPAIAYAGKPLGIGASDVIGATWRPLVASLSAAAIGFALGHTLLFEWGAFARLVMLALVYAVAYLLIGVGLLGVKMPVRVLLALIRDVLPVRLARLIRIPRFLEGRD